MLCKSFLADFTDRWSHNKEFALSWIENFKAKHLNEIYGHTYGEEMFCEMFSNKVAEGVFIFNGMDEEGKSM